MERYFKISENELVELLANSIRLANLEQAGVDNWDSGGIESELFEESCKEAGLSKTSLPEPGCGYLYDYTYEDLARVDLRRYAEIK